MAKLNGERMRYQTNKSSFWLCILSIIFNVASLISIYENKTINSDFTIGLDVLINILIMLIGFWGAEKTKTYHKNWSYILTVVVLIQFARIFFVPLGFFLKGQMTNFDFILNICFLSLSAIMLFGAAVICNIKSTILIRYLNTLSENEYKN